MLRVLFIPYEDDAGSERAAWSWLQNAPGIESRRVDAEHAAQASSFDPHVIWIHATSPGAGRDPALVRLKRLVGTRGILLTGGAAVLPVPFGLEPEPPNEVGRGSWRPDAGARPTVDSPVGSYPEIRGHATFRGHPLFHGLGHGTYTWAPGAGETHTTVLYRYPAWPMNGRVIAVERSYIHVNAQCATIWEYVPERNAAADGDDPSNRVLCIGAYVPFTPSDPRFQPPVERLVLNALHYVAGRTPPSDGETDPRPIPSGGAWRHRPPHTLEDPKLEIPDPPPLDDPLPAFDDPLDHSRPASDAPFTLAGRRAMATGIEEHGVDEIWIHPLRVLRNLRVEGATAAAARITPIGVERRLSVGGSPVTERIFVPRDVSGAVVEWRADPDGAGVDLTLDWQTDLRLMWPYPPGALGALRWRRTDRALFVRSAEPDDRAAFVLDRPPGSWTVTDDSTQTASAIAVRLSLRLEPGETVRLGVLGTTTGDEGIERGLARLRHPAALVRSRASTLQRMRRERLSITPGDERAGTALHWAQYRLDSYLTETPGLGRCLVAGYGPSAADGDDDGGRPGHAWFFGRDAVWTALASLAGGDFDAVRAVLRFLGDHQDPSGKILHECTTSGVVHYDAADATPLYLLLVARYAAWTGDLGFVGEQWPRVQRALDFCVDADTDEDGLIENARLGHDPAEFGRLAGGTVSFYTAGVWTAALRELAITAESLGDQAFAFVLRRRADQAQGALDAAFYDPDRRSYALDLQREQPGSEDAAPREAGEPGDDRPRDGSTPPSDETPDGPPAVPTWRQNHVQTAIQAVPLLLDTADADRAGSWLEAMDSETFTTPWGVRTLPTSAQGYDPGHDPGGAVRPLVTGWVSWAEFSAGRTRAAFRHWMMNVAQGFDREHGAWDDVLHGRERRGIGACPDRAWSTAMVVAPFVYGLLGVEPDAPRNRVRLRPQIPDAWDRLDVERMTIGDAKLTLRYRRDGHRHVFRLGQESGAVPLRVIFEPVLPARMLTAARVDGQDATLDPRPFGERLLVPLQIVLDYERTIELEVENADE